MVEEGKQCKETSNAREIGEKTSTREESVEIVTEPVGGRRMEGEGRRGDWLLPLRGFTFLSLLFAVGKKIGRGPLRVKTNNNRKQKKSNDPSLAILTIPSQHRIEAFGLPFRGIYPCLRHRTLAPRENCYWRCMVLGTLNRLKITNYNYIFWKKWLDRNAQGTLLSIPTLCALTLNRSNIRGDLIVNFKSPPHGHLRGYFNQAPLS